MDWRTSYHDLCKEIEILEERLLGIANELRFIKFELGRSWPISKLVASYSGMPHSSYETKPLAELCDKAFGLQHEIEHINDILSLKREARSRMEEKMDQFEGLEHKVMVMRDIQRKPLNEIADELGYSYGYIRKVFSKTKRMYTVNVKKGTIRSHTG